MTAIIIGPSVTSGVTGTGLSVTTGLSFGTGLILGFSGFTGIKFAASGVMGPGTIETEGDKATLAGAGGLYATLHGPSLTNPVTFSGAGSLLAQMVDVSYVTFNGAGSFNAVNAYVSNTERLSGTGSLSITNVFGAVHASVGFAGAGGNG